MQKNFLTLSDCSRDTVDSSAPAKSSAVYTQNRGRVMLNLRADGTSSCAVDCVSLLVCDRSPPGSGMYKHGNCFVLIHNLQHKEAHTEHANRKGPKAGTRPQQATEQAAA